MHLERKIIIGKRGPCLLVQVGTQSQMDGLGLTAMMGWVEVSNIGHCGWARER